MSTEFFKTLKEAESFAAGFNPKHVLAEVYSLDKPGTVKQFLQERDAAIAWERREADGARAVVAIFR